MELITQRGARAMHQAEFDALRRQYSSTLVDLGTGDGAWPRRFAREYGHCLAIGVDTDRSALREAAKRAERKPARGGAPNTLYVAAPIEALPIELHSAADWATIYFPWAALLRLILSGDPALSDILNQLCAPRARLSLVLNAEAAPEGFPPPQPKAVRQQLEAPLTKAGFRLTQATWLEPAKAPPTTWSGRLIKGSSRSMISLDATR